MATTVTTTVTITVTITVTTTVTASATSTPAVAAADGATGQVSGLVTTDASLSRGFVSARGVRLSSNTAASHNPQQQHNNRCRAPKARNLVSSIIRIFDFVV